MKDIIISHYIINGNNLKELRKLDRFFQLFTLKITIRTTITAVKIYVQTNNLLTVLQCILMM